MPNPLPCLSQACKQPVTRPALWVTESRHELWATMSKSGSRFTRMASTIHGKMTSGLLSSTDVPPADMEIPPLTLPLSAHPPVQLTSNRAGRKHNLVTHFPKDPICEVCRRTKVTRAPCRRHLDDRANGILIAERFGDMTTTDHTVLNEEQESRMHHSYDLVVQDLATQWIQSEQRKTKSAQET